MKVFIQVKNQGNPSSSLWDLDLLKINCNLINYLSISDHSTKNGSTNLKKILMFICIQEISFIRLFIPYIILYRIMQFNWLKALASKQPSNTGKLFNSFDKDLYLKIQGNSSSTLWNISTVRVMQLDWLSGPA